MSDIDKTVTGSMLGNLIPGSKKEEPKPTRSHQGYGYRQPYYSQPSYRREDEWPEDDWKPRTRRPGYNYDGTPINTPAAASVRTAPVQTPIGRRKAMAQDSDINIAVMGSSAVMDAEDMPKLVKLSLRGILDVLDGLGVVLMTSDMKVIEAYLTDAFDSIGDNMLYDTGSGIVGVKVLRDEEEERQAFADLPEQQDDAENGPE